MSGRSAIGVDLGGTRVRAAVITDAGELLQLVEASIAGQGPEAGLSLIQDLIAQLIEAQPKPLAGIGIGATGPIDSARGVINNPYTLQGWTNVPIVERLQRKFGVPARLDNDANAAALGELWHGAGRAAKRLYVVTIGTGVGTAYVVDEALQRGAGDVHPEGGHQLIDPNGPECYCGQRGCWESLIAGPSIARGRAWRRRRAAGSPRRMIRAAASRRACWPGLRRAEMCSRSRSCTTWRWISPAAWSTSSCCSCRM